MKKLVVLGMGLCMALAFTSCKSSESAYKKAYEKAKAQQAVQTKNYKYAVSILKTLVKRAPGFLEARTVYSEQLRYYLEQQGLSPYMTCAVSFHPKKHQLLKKYQKILAKYKKKKGITLTVLDNGRFVFEPVVLQKGEEESNQETK